MDVDQDGVISTHDVLRYLRQCGFDELLEQECQQLVLYFDNSEQGHLDYNDFMQIILPCDAPTLRAITMNKINVQRTTALIDQTVESELALLLFKEIVFSRQLDKQRMKLHSSKAFNLHAAFQLVDDWNYGYIDQSNLKNFLRKHGHVSSEAELMAIIRRMDLDGDARVNEQEFVDALNIDIPFSKAGFRRTERMQKTLVEQSLGPHFANSIRKSGSRHDSVDVINEKHSVGKQF